MKLKSAQKTVHDAQFSVHHAQIFVQRRTFFCAKEGLKDKGSRIKGKAENRKEDRGNRGMAEVSPPQRSADKKSEDRTPCPFYGTLYKRN